MKPKPEVPVMDFTQFEGKVIKELEGIPILAYDDIGRAINEALKAAHRVYVESHKAEIDEWGRVIGAEL
jgi:hypothetical protein